MTKEEMTKLLMESYDKGVEDAKQEAIIALEKIVAVMVAAEREACAKISDDADSYSRFVNQFISIRIRARGTT